MSTVYRSLSCNKQAVLSIRLRWKCRRLLRQASSGRQKRFKAQNSASLWQLDHRSKENFREGVMAQRAILLSSRSLNGREFPQSILKFLTATEDEAKQYLMDCIDNDIKENMNLNEIANNLNIFNVKENSFCMLKNDSDYLSQDVLTSGVRRIADRNH